MYIFDSTIPFPRIHLKEKPEKYAQIEATHSPPKKPTTFSIVHIEKSENTHMSTLEEWLKKKKLHRSHTIYYIVIKLMVQEGRGSASGNDSLSNLDSSCN